MKAEQLYIAGTEPPPDPERNEAIDSALDGWLAAKKKQATCAEATKMRHEVLLGLMAEHGVERYPFVDEVSGRKKYVIADKTPRAKTVNAPSRKQEGRERKADDPAERVESRRVSRSSVAAEIDPFASTRAAMGGESIVEEAERKQANEKPAASSKKRGGKAR